MSYQLTEQGVKHLVTNQDIPSDPMNRDWHTYVEWRDKGNTALPQTIIPPMTEAEEYQTNVNAWIKAVIAEAGLDPVAVAVRVRNMRSR